MEEIRRKRGRPMVGSIYTNQCKFRVTDEQSRRLKVAMQLSGKSQADILREALNKELNSIGVPAGNLIESDGDYVYDDYSYYGECDENDDEMGI